MGLGHRDGRNSGSFLIPYNLVGRILIVGSDLYEQVYIGVKNGNISLKASKSQGKRNTY